VWTPLFNGTDLAGWKNNGEEKWVAEQGTILCESTANKYGYLTTEKTYRDFDLRLKFKGETSGNCGVFFHSKITGIDPQHGPDIEGMQVEVDPSVGKHTGGLYESGGTVFSSTAYNHNRLAQTVLSLELQMDSRLHWIHFGLRATHTRRPCQMSWCEN